jgi:hypothetical protein
MLDLEMALQMGVEQEGQILQQLQLMMVELNMLVLQILQNQLYDKFVEVEELEQCNTLLVEVVMALQVEELVEKLANVMVDDDMVKMDMDNIVPH